MLPRSTLVRTPREVGQGRPGGRTLEIQRLVGRSLRAVVQLSRLEERTIIVDCDVLRADGGTRCASVTGAFVALCGALEKLKEELGRKEIDFLTAQLAAVSVGVVNGAPLLDLDYFEDSMAEVDMNVVMDDRGRFVELQGTAEEKPFSRTQLNKLTALASKGIERLIEAQKEALGVK